MLGFGWFFERCRFSLFYPLRNFYLVSAYLILGHGAGDDIACFSDIISDEQINQILRRQAREHLCFATLFSPQSFFGWIFHLDLICYFQQVLGSGWPPIYARLFCDTLSP